MKYLNSQEVLSKQVITNNINRANSDLQFKVLNKTVVFRDVTQPTAFSADPIAAMFKTHE